jgi:hypothetical protein
MKTLLIEISPDCAKGLQTLADRSNAAGVYNQASTPETIAAALVEVTVGRYLATPGGASVPASRPTNMPFAQQIVTRDNQRPQ